MRRAAAAMVAVALMAGTVGCGDDDAVSGTERRSMTLMLNWTPNTHHLGVYVAQQRGWYDEAGLDVRIVEPDSGGVSQAVAAGRADVGISMAEEVLPARAAGLPVVSIAALLPHNDSSLMALAGAGIERPADLEGRVYGGYGGALELELLSTLVDCDGGNPETVAVVEIGDADYLAGMQRDLFDVVWVFGGWDVLRADGVAGVPVTEIRFEDHFDCIPDWYTPLLEASEGTIAERPELLEAFLAATARGYEAATADPARAVADFLAAVPEADEQLLLLSAAYYQDRFVDPEVGPWGTQDPVVWSDFEAFARRAGLLTEPVDADAAFTNDLLPGADGPG